MKTVMAGAGKARIRIPDAVFPYENYVREESPIHARVLVLDYGEKTAIVSLEMPSVRNTEDMNCLKQAVADRTGTPIASIWICTTHNLCTMHIPPKSEPGNKHDLFLGSLLEAVGLACAQAMDQLTPVRIGIGVGSCDINTSRDIRTNQGWWNGIHGESVEDKRLTVFRFERKDGSLVALLYHYPIKCLTVQNAFYSDGTRISSSELAGASGREIEKACGATAIFLMGAAGDMVPKEYAVYAKTDANGDLVEVDLGIDRAMQIKERLGKELAGCVLDVANGISCRDGVTLRQRQVVWMYSGQEFYNEGKPYHPTPGYKYLPAADEDLEVTALAIGNSVLFGLQPETTAITGIQFREMVKGVTPLLVSLVNGGKDYMADKLSYERRTFCGTHSVFAKGTAEQFLRDAVGLIGEMYDEESSL